MMPDNAIDTAMLAAWVREFGRLILVNKDQLSELDSASGDADHGANMERGMVAVLATLSDESQWPAPGEFLKGVGMTLVSKVGGSSGALYGTIFLRMARAVGAAAALDTTDVARALHAAVDGVAERGQARAGDKTMYDALAPGVAALEAALADRRPVNAAWQAAVAAAEAGRNATIGMAARKGKSSYLGDKSIGSQDPGATSVTMLIAAAAAVLGNPRHDRSTPP